MSDEQETRTCHYCHKPGHLAVNCWKKAKDEGSDKRPTAALTDASGSSSMPPTATTINSVGPYSSGDFAAAAAFLAQQALDHRRADHPMNIYSVCGPEGPDDTPWPDTDDERWVCPLLLVNAIPGADPSDVWALYDSGSGLTTCPQHMFQDIVLEKGSHPCTLEAATGDAVLPIGKRRVAFRDESGEALGIEFTVTNVTKVIISADAMIDKGYVATLAADGSYLEHPLRGRIPLHRFGRTYRMRLKRTATEAKVCVAGMVRTPPDPTPLEGITALMGQTSSRSHRCCRLRASRRGADAAAANRRRNDDPGADRWCIPENQP